jgi:hypothetical protein
VSHAWLVDPLEHTLEAFGAAQGRWRSLGLFRGNDAVAVAPFDSVSIALSDLWV